jgi:uncharacterized protein (TIGR02145 family)
VINTTFWGLLLPAAGNNFADSASCLRLDSIRVMNLTRGGDTVLHWPDTVLSIYFVGIGETRIEEAMFRVFQNQPNPVTEQTDIALFVPGKDEILVIITDPAGRIIPQSDGMLDRGIHTFRFAPGEGNLFFFTAFWRNQNSSIRILRTGSPAERQASLNYLGSREGSPVQKSTAGSHKSSFSPGDSLLYIVYANGLESGRQDSPGGSEIYTFQFATNIPCPGTPTVTYEGRLYNTIQVLSQCWMKENLNVGTMIAGSQDQTDNSLIEKYCHNNNPDSCTKYGGLYQWDEMMNYAMQQGSQGICPPGWHIPSDGEWKILEGMADTQVGIGNAVWDIEGLRGFDAGKNLKTTSGWKNNGNGTDLFGFSAMPASYRFTNGTFEATGIEAVWWMSTQYVTDYAWYRNILQFSPKEGRFGDIYSFKGLWIQCPLPEG